MKRKIFNLCCSGFSWLGTAISVGVLIAVVGLIFKEGAGMVTWDFLTSDYNDKTSYVTLTNNAQELSEPNNLPEGAVFVPSMGLGFQKVEGEKESHYEVVYLAPGTTSKTGYDRTGSPVKLKKGTQILTIAKEDTGDMDEATFAAALAGHEPVEVKLVTPGGGILPMLVTTGLMILLSLAISIPIGVLASVYLVEYAKQGRFLSIIRFATESLAGIPSIVFGLFGMLFFVKFVNIGQSILSGSLTLSIILLPTVIRTTEETLRTVPQSYREGSYGLGANRLQTLVKIILPEAVPGILVAVILSIGWIVGESAALLFTAGTFGKMPTGILDTSASLTVRAFMEVKEYGNVAMASGIGVVLIIIVLVLNIGARLTSKLLLKNR